jgi:pilus assembly protein CpaB
MNKRFASVLLFAFIVAGGSSLLLYRLISSRMTALASPATSQVLLAARNLEVGTLIRETDLKTGDWMGSAPRGAAVKKEDVAGRGVVANIYEGEPVVESRLAARGAGAGLAATIPAGMRAVAVHVNEVAGLAGFVVPGMRVDVIISGNPPGSSRNNLGMLTKTILQNIAVLSAGQNIQKDAEGKPVSVQVVNLLVTPEQAEVLSLASQETRIQLVLRNPLDTDVAKTSGTAMSSLFSGQPSEPAPRARPKPVMKAAAPPPPAPVAEVKERVTIPITVELIHGSRKSASNFAGDPEVKP